MGGKKKSYKVLVGAIPPPTKRRFRTRPEYPDVPTFVKWQVPEAIIEIVKTTKPKPERTTGVNLVDASVPICVADLIDRQWSGEHLEHMQRVAVVGYLYTNYMAQDGKLTERRREMLYELFSGDPNYDPDITRYQVDDVVRRLEDDPTRLMKCGFLKTIVDTEFCGICKAVFPRKVDKIEHKDPP